jgi:hypothetical protein
MSAQEQMRIVKSIYDQFLDSLTTKSSAGEAILFKDNTFVVMEKKGRLIRSADYVNPYTPDNSSGDKKAAQNLMNLANEIPQISSVYAVNGSKVKEVYELALNSQVVTFPPNPSAEKSYKDAEDFISSHKADVTEYDAKKKLYNDALLALNKAFINANQTDEGRNNWPLLGIEFQSKVDAAYTSWRETLNASEIEDARAQKDTFVKSAINRVFADSKKDFDQSTRAALGDLGLVNYFTPSNWYDVSQTADWPEMTASSSSYLNEASSEFTSFGGGAYIDVGLWSVGGGGNSTTTEEHYKSAASEITVKFKYMTVNIDRPWLNYTLFNLPGWSVSGLAPGAFSTGDKNNQQNSKFPLLTQSFIVISNVEITANWSDFDKEQIKKAVNGDIDVGWGLFSLGGSYSNSSSNETVKLELAACRR